jgi:hypothetical protein
MAAEGFTYMESEIITKFRCGVGFPFMTRCFLKIISYFLKLTMHSTDREISQRNELIKLYLYTI